MCYENDIIFQRNYNLAKEFYDKYHNLTIPRTYIVVLDDGQIIKLGEWIAKLRKKYNKEIPGELTKKQIRMLEDIGMVWNIKGNDDVILVSWYKRYCLAKRYYEEHGNLLVPFGYTVKDDEGKIYNLGSWISNQRRAYRGFGTGKITKKQIKMLEDIGMVWEVKTYNQILKEIDTAYKMYEMGLLDQRNVDKLLEKQIFKYQDDKIAKGNAVVLSRKLAA